MEETTAQVSADGGEMEQPKTEEGAVLQEMRRRKAAKEAEAAAKESGEEVGASEGQ